MKITKSLAVGIIAGALLIAAVFVYNTNEQVKDYNRQTLESVKALMEADKAIREGHRETERELKELGLMPKLSLQRQLDAAAKAPADEAAASEQEANRKEAMRQLVASETVPGMMRSWSLTNGYVLKGALRMVDKETAWIEDESGKRHETPRTALQPHDQDVLTRLEAKLPK